MDVYDICSDNLKKELDKGKSYEKKLIEENFNKEQDLFEEYKK